MSRTFQLGDTPTEAIRDSLEADGFWRDALDPGWRVIPARESARRCRDCGRGTWLIHPDGSSRHMSRCTEGPRR